MIYLLELGFFVWEKCHGKKRNKKEKEKKKTPKIFPPKKSPNKKFPPPNLGKGFTVYVC